MTTETPALEAIVERLERLEKRDLRLKRAGFCVLLFVSAVLLTGQARPVPADGGGKVHFERCGRQEARNTRSDRRRISIPCIGGFHRESTSVGKPGASLLNPSLSQPHCFAFSTL